MKKRDILINIMLILAISAVYAWVATLDERASTPVTLMDSYTIKGDRK